MERFCLELKRREAGLRTLEERQRFLMEGPAELFPAVFPMLVPVVALAGPSGVRAREPDAQSCGIPYELIERILNAVPNVGQPVKLGFPIWLWYFYPSE